MLEYKFIISTIHHPSPSLRLPPTTDIKNTIPTERPTYSPYNPNSNLALTVIYNKILAIFYCNNNKGIKGVVGKIYCAIL